MIIYGLRLLLISNLTSLADAQLQRKNVQGIYCFVLIKESSVFCVHSSKVVQIFNENSCFHDIRNVQTSLFDDSFDVVQ